MGGQRRGPGAPAHPALLAGRRGAAHHLGPGHHAQGPHKARQNLGIYRQQVLNRNQLIMRWLAHRGGALDFREHGAEKTRPSPTRWRGAGADPATILGAVTPVPDSFVRIPVRLPACCGWRTEVAPALGDAAAGQRRDRARRPHQPAPPQRLACTRWKGPYGDHTGCYNEQAEFPGVHGGPHHAAQDAIYHSTYTGKPPDEPAVLGVALNELFVPLLQRQFPGNHRLLPAARGLQLPHGAGAHQEGLPGHARRVMMGVWSHLRQFMYTKFIVVVDEDVDVRDWKEVIWAMTTRMDPSATPCSSSTRPSTTSTLPRPVSGLGSKMGMDATNKWPGETQREWGRTITMDAEVTARMNALYESLGL